MGRVSEKLHGISDKIERVLSKLKDGDAKALNQDLMNNYRLFFSWLGVSSPSY